jgi:hypothetical protein
MNTAIETLARDALATYRDEFGPTEPLDEAWFTTAYEIDANESCDWEDYWDAVQAATR